MQWEKHKPFSQCHKTNNKKIMENDRENITTDEQKIVYLKSFFIFLCVTVVVIQKLFYSIQMIWIKW